MTCKPEVLRSVPLLAILDDDETAVLASQVEVKTFSPRERIYKIGDTSGQAYVMNSGKVRVTTVDEDQQEVAVDEPAKGEFFGFASMLQQTPHQTNAILLEVTSCLEVSRDDIAVLLQRKPLAGWTSLQRMAVSSMPRSNWYGCGRTATQMRSSKERQHSESASLIPGRALADHGPSLSHFRF